MQPLISWSTPEHIHKEKNNDWYWAVGIITITGASLAFIFNSFIFGILIIVSAFALVVHATKRPKTINVEITDRGMIMDNILYPFLTLESFWIDANQNPSKIILKSHKVFVPYIIVHIDEVDPEQVRDILLNYISETEHIEPVSQKILERFGF